MLIPVHVCIRAEHPYRPDRDKRHFMCQPVDGTNERLLFAFCERGKQLQEYCKQFPILSPAENLEKAQDLKWGPG